MDNQQLITLFTEHTGKQPCSVDELPSSGSNRRYFRLRAEGAPSIIGVLGTSVDENRAFIYMARHFATRGLPVPTILAVSDDDMCYLQTDLGDRMLFKEIEKDGQHVFSRPRSANFSTRQCAFCPKSSSQALKAWISECAFLPWLSTSVP